MLPRCKQISMEKYVSLILDVIVYVLAGALASWYYFHRRRKDLLGGFWGGAVIGTVGSVIIAFFAGTWFIEVVTGLMNPKPLFEGVYVRVNLITALIGAFAFVYILNRINHDRSR